MLVFGYAVLHAGFTDLYLRYVRAGFRPYLLVAGVALIVIGIATLWYEFRPARAGRGGEEVGETDAVRETGKGQLDRPERGRKGGHDHTHREPRIAWLFVLPLLALIVVVPPALGSYAADRSGTMLQKPIGFPPLPSGEPLQMTVVDYAGRAVYDGGRSLGARRIKITGFVTIGDGGRPYLNRMVLNCCAADALPVKVALSGRVPHALRPDIWLEVIGTYSKKQTRDEVNGGTIPFIDVSQGRQVPAPDDEYES
ncbi:MAG TPA: TIGR03943 family protein [Kineosporiaceae bacterium]|nr:TIGR03943 family protein [Kineosporiaceae bacterium]